MTDLDDQQEAEAFAATLRQRARGGPAPGDPKAEQINDLLSAHRQAMLYGDEAEQARILEQAQALLADPKPEPVDFGAGARPARQESPDMTELMRRAVRSRGF